MRNYSTCLGAAEQGIVQKNVHSAGALTDWFFDSRACHACSKERFKISDLVGLFSFIKFITGAKTSSANDEMTEVAEISVEQRERGNMESIFCAYNASCTGHTV